MLSETVFLVQYIYPKNTKITEKIITEIYKIKLDDMLAKIEYYTAHPIERKEVAKNGHRKIQQDHTYVNRIITIEELLFET